jgi:ParB family transcriptional regulator, chromosome partitioning protein
VETGINGMEKKAPPRLGRGLESLVNGPHFAADKERSPHHGPALRVPVGRIALNPYQPRKTFDEDELRALCDSIKIHGVLTPILVRPVGDKFQLVAGERRLRAAQQAGLTEIPAHVREMGEQQLLEAALVENIHRSDLNAIEKAHGFKDYLDKFQMTQEQLAARIGVDRTSISNLLGLLNLPAEVQDFVRSGALSLGHAKVLKGLSDARQQIRLSKEVIAKSLSVHALELLLKEHRDQKPDPTPAEKSLEAPKTAHVQSIEDELRQKLAVRVVIKISDKDKGQITLQFDSNDDFERLLEVLRK